MYTVEHVTMSTVSCRYYCKLYTLYKHLFRVTFCPVAFSPVAFFSGFLSGYREIIRD